MGKSCRLWSPVVHAELKKPRILDKELAYSLDYEPYRLDDLKIIIREHSSKRQGKTLEGRFVVEFLALLENEPGNMKLFARNEVIRDRIQDAELAGDSLQKGIELITDIQDINWDADLKGKTIKIKLTISYTIMAIRKQIIEVNNESIPNEYVVQVKNDEELLSMLQAEIIKAEADKMELKRRIHCFETDIMSLKKGINKAENRNLGLNEELAHRQEIINNLRDRLQDKEKIKDHISQPANSKKNYPQGYSNGEEGLGIGGIIKRLFHNNE